LREVYVLQSILNSVDALSPEDGHILVVGDLWMNQAECQQLPSNARSIFNQCGAGLLALGAVGEGYQVTLAGFVGDDDLADAVEANFASAGVATDLLHIRGWSTFTDAALDITANVVGEDANGRALRRHKDERALPIDGMSEYQAHLQNRAERYLRNASAIVLVDYDLGSIAEPRALTYTASKLNKPCVAMLGHSSQPEKYRDVRCYDVTGQRLEPVVSSVINALKELIG
jgi:bifunctional ADP-heptose synthase (sugar kinase/adenylyltransferase)